MIIKEEKEEQSNLDNFFAIKKEKNKTIEEKEEQKVDWVHEDGSVTKEYIRNINPWDVIKHVAKLTNTLIQEPKPNCKHCYGRGYIGKYSETGEPIACKCIYVKMAQNDKDISDIFMPRKMNRKERRSKK